MEGRYTRKITGRKREIPKKLQEELQEKLKEELHEKLQEKLQEEKINFAKSLLDILDDETIAEKTGLDINFIKSLRM